MSPTEEVIDATLEPDGTLRLSHQPQLPPGPVRVTVQTAGPSRPRRTLGLLRDRNFPGAAHSRCAQAARERCGVPSPCCSPPPPPSAPEALANSRSNLFLLGSFSGQVAVPPGLHSF